MKIFILTVISSFLMLGSSQLFAQAGGEIDRFNNESLEERVNEVKMFPNPTVDYLKVRINNSNLVDAELTVHNIIGNVINVKVEKDEKDEYVIRVKDLPQGYYLLAIRDKQGYFKETYKFLKR